MSGPLLPTLVATVFAVIVVMCALGLGVWVGRRPIAGSCGRGTGQGCVCEPGARVCELESER